MFRRKRAGIQGECSLFSYKIVQQTFRKESEQQQGKRDRNGADREQYRVARVLGNPTQHDRTQPDAEVGGSRKRSIGYPFTVRADKTYRCRLKSRLGGTETNAVQNRRNEHAEPSGREAQGDQG